MFFEDNLRTDRTAGERSIRDVFVYGAKNPKRRSLPRPRLDYALVRDGEVSGFPDAKYAISGTAICMRTGFSNCRSMRRRRVANERDSLSLDWWQCQRRDRRSPPAIETMRAPACVILRCCPFERVLRARRP